MAELLGDSAFHPLEQWLLQRQVPIDDLQAAVDQFLDQAKQIAEGSTTEDTEEHRGETGN